MNLISMILYGAGVIGVIISLVLTFVSISKHNKISFLLIGCTFTLSLFLVGSGTFVTLNSVKSNNLNDTASATDNSHSNIKTSNATTDNSKKNVASIEDLKFKFDLDKTTNTSQKNASITIENRSDSIFNGKIKLNFTDSSSKTTDTIEIPVNNLMPKSSYSPKVLVSNSASNADYSFSGTFGSSEKKDIPYTVKKISIGNNSYRFDVSVKDTSYSSLQSISKDFMNEYTSSVCSSFLIYFYPPDKGDKSNLNDAIGDFYYDYSSNTSKLTTY